MVTFRIEKQTNQTDIKWFGGGRKTDDPRAPPPPPGEHTRAFCTAALLSPVLLSSQPQVPPQAENVDWR